MHWRQFAASSMRYGQYQGIAQPPLTETNLHREGGSHA